jgi:hypothetical protein
LQHKSYIPKRLIVLPEYSGSDSGYQKAVAADLARLKPTSNDFIVYYSSSQNTIPLLPNERVIYRSKLLSSNRLKNTLTLRVSSELRSNQLRKITQSTTFDEIICGDVTLYRAIKALYPDQKMVVRFHNFFSLVLLRNAFLGFSLGWLQSLQFNLLKRLEKEILQDPQVTPAFITREDHTLFKLIYPNRLSMFWEVITLDNFFTSASQVPDRPIMIWLGGISQHKKYSLLYFIENVYKPLHKKYPVLELHLYGKGTEKIANESIGIQGHGYWSGSGFPFEKKALFINPDLLGGGIKLKIGDWLLNGIPFITTPFGMDGYTIAANEHLLIEPLENWFDAIQTYFIQHGLIQNPA